MNTFFQTMQNMENIRNFSFTVAEQYGALILLFFALFAIGLVIGRSIKRQEKSIRKLWSLILFFLGKRQMMLPLIYTLSKRENFLTADQQQKILEIREQARQLSWKKNPSKRLKLEKEVSKILSDFFAKKEFNSKKNEELKVLTDDLKFIDTKLEELQNLYNQNATEWNAQYHKTKIQSFLAQKLRIHKFELFKE